MAESVLTSPRTALSTSARIHSIDFLRGIVMILMVLDHSRFFFHQGHFSDNPLNLETTTPLLFMTRWITHLCAPIFVFLAGTAAHLHGHRLENKAQLSRFLWTRGLWLVLLEVTVVAFAWFFDPTFSIVFLQVIWAIGMSMILMSLLVYLPLWAIVALGLVIVLGHNLFDSIQPEHPGVQKFWILAKTHGTFLASSKLFFVFYPVLPWLGIMCLGYGLGIFYRSGGNFSVATRRRFLLWAGLGALALFVLLRLGNIYGDPVPWSAQKSGVYTFLSFINVNKYPPSLHYALVMLGIALLLLRALENIKFRGVGSVFITFGRVPLFFYILHLYIIHTFALLGAPFDNHPWHALIITPNTFQNQTLANYGYSLGLVYAVWIFVLSMLYPLCLWYMEYKAKRKDQWWLSYL